MTYPCSTQPDQTAIDQLVAHIRRHGPVLSVRVSSAQARGRAGQYAYWGAVRYEIRLRQRDGVPANCATERASSDRRSERLAHDDANAIADAEGRVWLGAIGGLTEADAASVLRQLGLLQHAGHANSACQPLVCAADQ